MFLAGVNNVEEYNIKKEGSPEYLEEYVEYLEDVKPEFVSNSMQIVFENDTAKCGEVMVGYEGEFTFICVVCRQPFHDLPSFGNHIKGFHLNYSASTEISTEKNNRDPLCEEDIVSFVSSQLESRPESPRNASVSSRNASESSKNASIGFQNALAIENLETAASSHCNDNISKDGVSNCDESIPVEVSNEAIKVREFACTLCGRSFTLMSSYRRHMKKQHPNGVPDQIICKYCSKEFENLIQLEAHLRTHTGPMKYVCPLCPKVFNSVRRRQVHINVHNGERPYKCPHCPAAFADPRGCERHKRDLHAAADLSESEHHQVKNDNDSKLELKVVVSDHAASLNNEDNMDLADVVSNCEQKSSDSSKVEKIVCTECGRTYRKMSSYIAHMKEKHTGPCESPPDQTICRYCHKEFENAEELRAHVAAHTGRRRFVCPFCPKTFYTVKSREYHVNTHTGERPHKCSLCPKTFAHPHNLVKHEHAHLKIMRYSCDYCGKRFVQQSCRKIHERIHTGEKPFQCEECGQRFMSHVRMTEHAKRHKNIKPYICTVCNKGFYNSNLLKDHMPIHTGERPFQCKFCGKSYPRKKSLRSHLQLHTNDKKYVCNLCGEAFLQSTGLYTHRKTHGENL